MFFTQAQRDIVISPMYAPSSVPPNAKRVFGVDLVGRYVYRKWLWQLSSVP